MKEHLEALLKSRNELATAVSLKGDELMKRRHEIDTTMEKGSTELKEAYDILEAEIIEQKSSRSEIEKLDELIDAASAIQPRELAKSGVKPDEAVTGSALSPAGMSALYPNQKKKGLWERIGVDFHQFVTSNGLHRKDDIKSRQAIAVDTLKDGQRFNSVASFYATFGDSYDELNSAYKSVGQETQMGDFLETAVKANRDTMQKSMFTQHPLAGGAGALYSPTSVFPGNTGGLCEYFIDDSIEVLPYPPVSFLECIPVRRIPKSYLLYVRQTLRVNNASAVGESVVLEGTNNPTGAPVNFRVEKPESEFGFSQAKAYTLTFADTLPVSEEFLEDCPQIADIVENQLMENVRQEFYDQIINGDGSTGAYPELLGLLAQVGLSTRVHRGAASFMGNTMGAGVADDNIRETFERAIWDAEAYGYTVDCILTNHDDFIKMAMYKDGDDHKLYSDADLQTIRGVKVRKDVRMPAGTALIGAFRQVVQILIRRAIRLDIGWVDDQFKIDMLTLRATMRGGLLVKVPHALIRVTSIA